ncbi:uncharacterized protein A4U43_C04F6270 [Asparagus officinalis]|uniref:non-specific serine/threonine protein kinase n=1 Tax=Asparagus officinalis TaxID=4686 RepID=A0A5P1EZC5_ASPOF|nr:serine/threonine-protein kinase D6PK-like [Asparagus officinalis]XP_020260313.1 serine/threonine-protein kinase D6PK-like [Asparagus officinalis]ONK71234.1 uncharacterized protein A4U43_C04F6270 [Asparagus officinalis]
MASSAASTSEIVEEKDEFDLLRNFGRANRLKIKPRATKCKPDSGLGVSESPSLKQALRRLCISQASEMAAIKRSSKLLGSASVSDAETIERLYASIVVEANKESLLLEKETKNSTKKEIQVGEARDVKSSCKSSRISALRNLKMRRTQDLLTVEHKSFSKKKGKQKSVQAADSLISRLNKFSSNSKDGGHFAIQKDEGLVSREKGECSESSQSSLGDSISSSTISEESSYCRSSSNCNRPHMSKDVRWSAINHVVKEHGSLGLKNFKLLRRIGCGDIGTIYLAELIGSGCLFALKVMDVEFLVSRKKMLRAQTERDILQMLDHPFLPTLYAHFTADNLLFFVMEYCTGGDLHVLRQMQLDRRFHEPAARFYVAEVLLALEYLHMVGVIYRDLKPENILVREDGHIMLSDFDLSMKCSVSPTFLNSSLSNAKTLQKKVPGQCTSTSCMEPFCFTPRLLKSNVARVSRLPQLVVEPTDARSNSFVGTHEYLAPEIIRGDGHGSSVDWWTLGIFLYELLFGRTPFKGSGNEDTLANVVSLSLIFPESPVASVSAKDLIRGLLTKDPERRLGSVRGAAEIKQHPFFEGLNLALIRCTEPPEVPGIYSAEINQVTKVQEAKYVDF